MRSSEMYASFAMLRTSSLRSRIVENKRRRDWKRVSSSLLLSRFNRDLNTRRHLFFFGRTFKCLLTNSFLLFPFHQHPQDVRDLLLLAAAL